MTLFIDGHNLIPKIPGMSLRQIDDEPKLADLLQIYARLRRKTIEVFFDGAPPGKAGRRAYGTVVAHFVPASMTADSAIRAALVELGKQTHAVTVISSDRMVQAEARSLGARVVSSEQFAREVVKAWQEEAALAPPPKPSTAKKTRAPQPPPPARTDENRRLSPTEVDEWMKLFQKGKDDKKK